MTKMEWADNGNQIIDGIEYTGRRILSVESLHGDDVTYAFEGGEVVDECECCGRFSTRLATATSIKDAVKRGYLTPIPKKAKTR